MINGKAFPQEMKPFVDKIAAYSKRAGILDCRAFLKERLWKIKSLNSGDLVANVTFHNEGTDFIAVMDNPRQDVLKWLPVLCDFTLSEKGNGFIGELKYKGTVYNFEIKQGEKKHTLFTVKDVKDNRLQLLLKRLVYKAAFCVQCEVCEVDCPTGALQVWPQVNIDTTKCIHCYKCMNTHDRGCIAADCIRMIKDTDKKMNTKLQGYKTFGLREDWIDEYFVNPTDFWKENSLGTAQVDSVKAWLRDAEITDAKHNITPMGELMKDIYGFNQQMFWEITFINLTYHSAIVEWFASNIAVNQPFNKAILADAYTEQGYTGSMATLKNAVSALIDLLKKSPLGTDCCQGVDNGNGELCRIAYDNLSEEATAYSLYKYANEQGISSYRVSDIYRADSKHSIAKEFCLSRTDFERILRQLSVSNTHILNAELNMGLDHITLREDLNALTALKLMLGV